MLKDTADQHQHHVSSGYVEVIIQHNTASNDDNKRSTVFTFQFQML